VETEPVFTTYSLPKGISMAQHPHEAFNPDQHRKDQHRIAELEQELTATLLLL